MRAHFLQYFFSLFLLVHNQTTYWCGLVLNGLMSYWPHQVFHVKGILITCRQKGERVKDKVYIYANTVWAIKIRKETEIQSWISQNQKEKSLNCYQWMMAYLFFFHMVHWLFLLGQGRPFYVKFIQRLKRYDPK